MTVVGKHGIQGAAGGSLGAVPHPDIPRLSLVLWDGRFKKKFRLEAFDGLGCRVAANITGEQAIKK